MVPLFPGDLLLMTGSMQVHMAHKTLTHSQIVREVLGRYPAVNPRVRVLFDQLIEEVGAHGPRDRGVMTYRRSGRATP